MFTLMPDDLQKECEQLIALILESEEELTIDEFIEKYASKEYKEWVQNEEKLAEKRWKEEGIIIN